MCFAKCARPRRLAGRGYRNPQKHSSTLLTIRRKQSKFNGLLQPTSSLIEPVVTFNPHQPKSNFNLLN